MDDVAEFSDLLRTWVMIAGPKAWNNLPQSVRSADSLDSFKRKL